MRRDEYTSGHMTESAVCERRDECTSGHMTESGECAKRDECTSGHMTACWTVNAIHWLFSPRKLNYKLS